MISEDRQRIEQIRNGGVPDGYARTLAGILPEDWSCAKLSDISEIITKTAGNRAIETVSISAGIGFVNQAQKFGKELSGNQYSKYTVLQRGDFAYNKGNSNRYPQGCIYMLKDRDEAAVPNVFECFRVHTGVPEYYEQLFIHGFMNKQLARLINHGVRDDGLLNLTDKDFYSVTMPLPPIDEQRRIVEVLAACDRVIELKQKLVDELKKLKKVCLTKMFPQEGETVPEIRFPGFTVPWERCKLGEVSDIKTGPFGSTLHANDYVINGYPIITTEHFKSGELPQDKKGLPQVSEEDYHRLSSYVLDDGDIVFSRVGSVDVNALVTSAQAGWLFSGRVLRVRPEKTISSIFLHTLLETKAVKNDICARAVGQTMPSINTDILRHTQLIIPRCHKEQKSIGLFCREIDCLISLYQHELEMDSNKKIALMQLLLTGIVRV